MLTLLAAASAEAAQVAGESGAAALVERFGIQGKYVAMQFVSFAILAFVLYRFAIKPTLVVMDERNAKIETGLKNAEATTAQLAAAQQQAAAQLKEAQIAAGKIIDEARQTAKELADREAAAAAERAQAFIAKARQATELEHKKMLDEARAEIARLVVTTTERVLAKKLTDADRASYNEAAARELTTV